MNTKKKSTKEKELTGTLNTTRDTTSINAPGLDIKTLRAPTWLNTIGKKWYNSTLINLDEAGLLKETDLTTLGLCASAYADFISANSELKQARDTTPVNLDLIIKLQTQKNRQLKSYLDFAKELGLTSISRGKILVSTTEEDDPFGEF